MYNLCTLFVLPRQTPRSARLRRGNTHCVAVKIGASARTLFFRSTPPSVDLVAARGFTAPRLLRLDGSSSVFSAHEVQLLSSTGEGFKL